MQDFDAVDRSHAIARQDGRGAGGAGSGRAQVDASQRTEITEQAYVYGCIGSRATGNEAGCYVVSGPGWKGATPPGVAKSFTSETEFSLAIYRTQLFGPSDMLNVKKIQAGYRVQPLSAFLKQTPPPAPPTPKFPAFTEDAFKTGFVGYLNFLQQFTPPVPEETALRAKFAEIGIGPGKPYDFRALPLEDRLAVEALYPMAVSGSEGRKLDGSQHRYTITIPKDQLPPVNAFWSVTMYDGKTQLLVENPIDRYLINPAKLPDLKKNADGSLTLYIQKDSPGAAKQSNRLASARRPLRGSTWGSPVGFAFGSRGPRCG